MKAILNKYSNIVYLFATIFISLFLLVIFFNGMKPGEFLFIHDEFLAIDKQESSGLFLTRHPIDFGTANSAFLIFSFFDRVYYSIMYFFNLNIELVQRILYFIKLFILIYLPFQGFIKLSKLYLNQSSAIAVFFISLWYSFNTFSLIYWNGNGFCLTLLVCYALSPLALYYYHKSIFCEGSYLDKFKTILLFCLMSFASFFFVLFALLVFIYTILYALLSKIKFIFILKNILILSALFLPFLAMYFLVIYDMFVYVSPTVNLVGGETYGNLQGGFLYPLLMWFSWGFYVVWEPRNIFTFHRYYQTIPSILAPFIIYGLIFIGMIKKKWNIFIPIFIFLFLVCLLFIKGAQMPFGDIYLFLLDHVSFFRVFRSPDTKFGFGIVFVVSVLLLLVSVKYRKKVFIPLLAAVILIQGYPLLTGIGIKGENNAEISSDRVIHLTRDYRELTNYLNKNSQSYGYVMTFPSTEFDHYELGEGERHIGQDLLPKLTSLPFLYLSQSAGMLSNTYKQLLRIMETGDISEFRKFPIRYFIIRRDNRFPKDQEFLKDNLAKEFNLVFSNPLFDVYENLNALPIIKSDNISFKMINPVKYQIFFKNIKQDQLLYFYQNYHQDWKLYLAPYINNSQLCGDFINHEAYHVKECRAEKSMAGLDDFTYLFRRPLYDNTHAPSGGYANSWRISPEYIKANYDRKYFKLNPDGSVDFTMVLFFRIQSMFYAGVVVAGVYFLIISSVVLFKSAKNNLLPQ